MEWVPLKNGLSVHCLGSFQHKTPELDSNPPTSGAFLLYYLTETESNLHLNVTLIHSFLINSLEHNLEIVEIMLEWHS